MNKIIQRQRIANTCRIRLPSVVIICFPLILSHLRCFDVQGIYNYTVLRRNCLCGYGYHYFCNIFHQNMRLLFSIQYIEKLPIIRLKENIADTKWIYATYRIFCFSVKSGSRQMRLWGNKKGKSKGSDSPLCVVITIEYPNNFQIWYLSICWRSQRF